ncbi:hypothetical protein DPMN_072825 [Dreissena polymorpha]|uniref:protein-tyrosine-phosphatase n=2 Tax=Dreissena polymorpha TaxID=45954 RepID=A0A9D4BXZ2_DREPO|nr:hypothetical protein DPMN_072825 [Dreissena polymorpha]
MCNQNTSTCSYGCKVGYYGDDCKRSCSSWCANKFCSTPYGICSPCMNGYTGYNCADQCAYGCLNNICGQNDRKCTNGCKIRFYGDSCESQCPPKCQSCLSAENCTACVSGYYGSKCESQCPDTCETCSNNGKCTICKSDFSHPNLDCQCSQRFCASGLCQSCTNSTYYLDGEACCPCSANCQDSVCKTALQCTHGCVDGYYGEVCDFKCSDRDFFCSVCILEANHLFACKTCKEGYFPGKNALCTKCSESCVDDPCNNSNGNCKHGCKQGFWSSKCDIACTNNCSVCDQNNGHCLQCSSPSMYGTDCNMLCSDTCVNASCLIDGTCTNGCIYDYYGPSCEKPCPTNCGHSDNKTRCSNATGLCLFGCNEGFKGEDCMEAPKFENSKDTLPVAAIGGGVAACVISALVVIIVLFIYFRRRRPGPKNETIPVASNNESNASAPMYALVTRREHPVSVYENTSSVKANNTTVQVQNPGYTKRHLEPVSPRDGTSITTEDSLEIDEWDSIARNNAVIFEENGGVYYNNSEKVKTLKISVAELYKFVMSKNMDYFKKEFEKLPYGLLKEYRVSQMKENIAKNRYKGIYPYDDCRVKVRGGDTDYINASFIDGYKRRNEYIATLGPMSKQLGNFATFWRMAWQHNVETIVMVTNLVEEGKDKCEKYWPSVDAPQMYDDIQVLCQSEHQYAEFTRRTFTVIKERQTRTLTQLHFTSWPDKDVPEDVSSIIEFRQNVLRAPATLEGPTIVHCSAGIGRTGTYIAIDILTKEGEAEGAIDIPGCVLNMRQNRPNMVQTAGQYAYLHHAVVHSLTFECQPVSSGKFQLYMDTTSKDKIRNIFHQLQETASCGSSDETEAVARNAKRTDKNRDGADIPGDEHRPKLYLNRKPGSTDYINAVFWNSFQKKNNYILAQTPLPNTVIDFLALLVQTNCACIVSLESGNMNAVDIGVYLPADNHVLKNGIFSVRCSKTDANEYRNKRMLTVEHRANQANESLSLTYLEFTDWNTEERIPNSPANFRRLIAEVDAVTANSSDRPVLIHCLDGASKCGLFCVVANLLQKMEMEHEVSVANAVRKVKTRRKGAIPNLEQFQFCHDCVLDYTQSFNIYSNIAAELSDC